MKKPKIPSYTQEELFAKISKGEDLGEFTIKSSKIKYQALFPSPVELFEVKISLN